MTTGAPRVRAQLAAARLAAAALAALAVAGTGLLAIGSGWLPWAVAGAVFVLQFALAPRMGAVLLRTGVAPRPRIQFDGRCPTPSRCPQRRRHARHHAGADVAEHVAAG